MSTISRKFDDVRRDLEHPLVRRANRFIRGMDYRLRAPRLVRALLHQVFTLRALLRRVQDTGVFACPNVGNQIGPGGCQCLACSLARGLEP